MPSVADLFSADFHDGTPKSVFSFDGRLNVTSIPYVSELLRNTLHIWNIHRAQWRFFLVGTTAALGVNGRVRLRLLIS
jgi:hypothetical protein